LPLFSAQPSEDCCVPPLLPRLSGCVDNTSFVLDLPIICLSLLFFNLSNVIFA
jgi:hypothetical protein